MNYLFDLIMLQCTNKAVACLCFQQVVGMGFDQNGLRLQTCLDSKPGAVGQVSSNSRFLNCSLVAFGWNVLNSDEMRA